jgi:hypothetical protein
VRESDLAGHLENSIDQQEAADDESTSDVKQEVKTIIVAADSEGDAVLDEALNILKQMSADKQMAISQ